MKMAQGLQKKRLENSRKMTRSELKEFEKRQKQAKADRDWDLLMMADLLND